MRTLTLGILFLLAASLEAQRTLRIPADRPTIQSGIDAANPGDTVLVSPGTYSENVDFHGKPIVLQSAEGPTVTILDGRRLAPTVSFTTGETRASTLIGFTVRNGAPAPASPNQTSIHGAGILLRAASPTLSGNILTDNLCAAIDATASAPLITGNQVTRTRPDPTCLAQAIAPITLTGAAADPTLLPTLSRNTIEQNDLTGTEIQPNAGAITLLAARAILQSNIIRGNIVSADAPAIQILAEPTPAGTIPTLFQQNLVYGNTSRCSAGLAIAILNDASSHQTPAPHLEIQVFNNTVVDNITASTCDPGQAAELALSPGSLAPQIALANNILASSTDHPALACSASLPAESFHHNLLHNTAGPGLSPSCPDSAANLLDEPRFLDRAQSDYHLTLRSTAVDAGSNAVSPTLQRDLDNASRPQNATGQPTAIIDLGAYEFPAATTQAASTTVLNATPSTSEAFQSVALSARVTAAGSTVPTGTVAFTAGGQILATLALDATGHALFTTTSLAAASYRLTATYSGSDTLAPSTSAPILQTVNPATTILAFSITPSDASQSQTVTLTARVTAPLSSHTPGATVQFFELPPTGPPMPLGAPMLDATGHATLNLMAMSVGSHHITASYPGTPDFTPVVLPTSDALILNIVARDYTQALATPTLTLASEHHGPITVTLTSLGSFADTLTLACTNLPADASCTFAPSTMSLTAGSSGSLTLMVDTDAAPGFAQNQPPVFSPASLPASRLAPIAFSSLFPSACLRSLPSPAVNEPACFSCRSSSPSLLPSAAAQASIPATPPREPTRSPLPPRPKPPASPIPPSSPSSSPHNAAVWPWQAHFDPLDWP